MDNQIRKMHPLFKDEYLIHLHIFEQNSVAKGQIL
jgi:hypothetical protein